mmetsp:Transcript_88212/g.175217  ORF Transcript_88212/g.175217 Transcript_88212/m.175217 type:complete len:387 (-) Transcript_88212:95-1255(-)
MRQSPGSIVEVGASPAPRAPARASIISRHLFSGPCASTAAPLSNVTEQRKRLSWCIVGAGAIGGLVGARLAQAGETVTMVARRAHLEAMQGQGGIRVVAMDGSSALVPVRAVGSLAEVGAVDVAIITLKAQQIRPVLADLSQLFHDKTVVVSMQNGLPWWYFLGQDGPYKGRQLESVDPGGEILRAIEPERIIGCIPYPAAHIRVPGEVVHTEGNLLPLGELDGSASGRTSTLSDALVAAGFKAPVLPDIRANMWVKLLGNLCFNPMGALTHTTLDILATYPPSVAVVRSAMEEASAVAASLGVKMNITVDRRIAGAARVGAHKPSTLQDVEQGKPTEVDALILAVVELAELTGTPAPTIRTLCACMQLLNKTVEEKKVKIQATPL